MRGFFPVAISVLMVFPSSAFAIKPYRCNGRIQFTRCPESVAAPSSIKGSDTADLAGSNSDELAARRLATGYKTTNRHNRPQEFARIIEQQFSQSPTKPGIGMWKGKIEGNGDVHLGIEFTHPGRPAIKRYMGKVNLSNTATTFKFLTAFPPGRNWSWNLFAFNG